MAITLSNGIRNVLASLQDVSKQSQIAQLRLATGKKINSAIDGPKEFFIAQGLQSRGSDLSKLLDDMKQASKTLEAADKGIQGLIKLVETAQGNARQALQSASTSPKLVGSNTLSSVQDISALTGNLTIATDGGTNTTNITLGATDTDTVAELITKINNDTSLNGTTPASRVRASLSDAGKLVIESVKGTGTNLDDLAVTFGTATDGNTLFGAPTTGTWDAGQTSVDATANSTRSTLAATFATLRSQVDQLAEDSGYNGVNLLSSDTLKVVFNEGNSSSLLIEGVDASTGIKGLDIPALASGYQSDSEISAALDKLSGALTKLRTTASTFGANLAIVNNRQDFTQGLITTLQSGADALLIADQNEESANLLALSTRQQLSTTSLSLASQADQGVLRLF
jgi:flagellin